MSADMVQRGGAWCQWVDLPGHTVRRGAVRVHQPRRRGTVRAVRYLLATLGVAVALVVLAGPAGAHAVLIASDPAADALVDSPPTEIVLRFNEGVESTADAVRLLDPSGAEVGGVTSTAEDVTVRAELPELDEDGSYTVDWSAVSADGHPIRGAYLFHLRERTLDAPVDSVTRRHPAGGDGPAGAGRDPRPRRPRVGVRRRRSSDDVRGPDGFRWCWARCWGCSARSSRWASPSPRRSASSWTPRVGACAWWRPSWPCWVWSSRGSRVRARSSWRSLRRRPSRWRPRAMPCRFRPWRSRRG